MEAAAAWGKVLIPLGVKYDFTRPKGAPKPPEKPTERRLGYVPSEWKGLLDKDAYASALRFVKEGGDLAGDAGFDHAYPKLLKAALLERINDAKADLARLGAVTTAVPLDTQEELAKAHNLALTITRENLGTVAKDALEHIAQAHRKYRSSPRWRHVFNNEREEVADLLEACTPDEPRHKWLVDSGVDPQKLDGLCKGLDLDALHTEIEPRKFEAAQQRSSAVRYSLESLKENARLAAAKGAASAKERDLIMAEVERIQSTGRYWTEGNPLHAPLSEQGRAIDARLRANRDALKPKPATAPEDGKPKATAPAPARAPEDGPAQQPKPRAAQGGSGVSADEFIDRLEEDSAQNLAISPTQPDDLKALAGAMRAAKGKQRWTFASSRELEEAATKLAHLINVAKAYYWQRKPLRQPNNPFSGLSDKVWNKAVYNKTALSSLWFAGLAVVQAPQDEVSKKIADALELGSIDGSKTAWSFAPHGHWPILTNAQVHSSELYRISPQDAAALTDAKRLHTAPPKPAPSALEDEFAELAELVGGKAGQLAKEAAAQLRAATAAKEAAALLRGAGLDDLAGGFADLAKMMS
jgi:hypothetical protein